MTLRFKTLALGLTLAGSIVTGSLGALEAHAAYAVCRADPVVLLSNGYRLNITATVQATSSTDVQSIHFDVHGPKGTTVRKINYVSKPPAGSESVTYYADQSSSTGYMTSATVKTQYAGDAVSVTSTVLKHGTTYQSVTTTGVSNTAIVSDASF